MFAFAALWDVLVFAIATLVLGATLGPKRITDPLSRLAAGVALGVAVHFALGFGGFVLGFSNSGVALAGAVLGGATIAARRECASSLLAAPEVRDFVRAWLVFVAWSLGLLALVVSYSGGGWAVDWFEHWQRTEFFILRQPLETKFAAIYTLTARPPLVNLTIALWLEGSSATFAHFQILTTLFGSLVLLPMVILARRWGAGQATYGWVLLVAMANPLLAQNLTFSWTKLPTAFFVLTGVVLCLTGLKPASRTERTFAALCLGLGVLAHYSAVPWLIAITVAFVGVRLRDKKDTQWMREVPRLIAVSLALPAIWFAWSALHFGSTGTVAANTTTAGWNQQTSIEHLTVPFWNLFDTIVPFLIRGEPADGLIIQASQLGRLRDVAFSLYQVNLPLAFGFGGLLVLLLSTRQRDTRGRPQQVRNDNGERTFWWIIIPLVVILGIAVHTPRDHWGLAHICLQPLILLGLAKISAELEGSRGSTKAVWAVLAALDFLLGIALHFGLESGSVARFLAPEGGSEAYVRMLSLAANANSLTKTDFHLQFIADRLHAPVPLIAIWLAACVTWAIVRLRQVPATSA